ncbi:aldehyde dehydrogenase family protein [Bradyrhizobium sp. 164]|uniref:aldehyde dehydrogenase family protein n=1 Tax=Bradyrhizobium sp. 164 TaxID=2782637 RepID=UPI002097AE8C|nr:aldehyde dehydrogenase family protein [Bradyrhizobium sp. 164]
MTALASRILFKQGLPEEMLSILTGTPGSMEDAISPTRMRSACVGRYIAAGAGYRKLILELGGNDPIIVLEEC